VLQIPNELANETPEMPAPSNQLFNLTEWPALDEENIHIKNANYDLFCSPGLVGNADSDETYNTPSPSSVRSIDPTGEFNMATELPARPPVEGSVPIRTITAMQPTIEDEDKDVDEGCESALLQRADPSLLERRHSLQSKEPAYLPTPPSDSPTPPLPHKSHHVSSQLFRVTKPRSKEKSVKKRNSIPMKKSAIQTNPMSNKQASQSNDIDMPTTQAVVNPQQPEYPDWVREDIAYDLMWSQFVADPKVEMSEVALRDALDFGITTISGAIHPSILQLRETFRLRRRASLNFVTSMIFKQKWVQTKSGSAWR
jgi:hypothetical protein